MKTISFKIDEALYAELQRLAEQRTGFSANTLSRQIVTDYLQNAERERLFEAVAEVKQELQHLHKDVITATFGLLLRAGQMKDAQQAKAWLDKTMLGRMTEVDG